MDKNIINLKFAKRGVFGSVVAILIITLMEFPPPIGFETRPQTGVSIYWLFFFLVILITEIVAMPLIFKHPNLGWKFGVLAGTFNILQVIADQTHLMQPEVASLGYSMLEGAVVLASMALIYFSLEVKNIK